MHVDTSCCQNGCRLTVTVTRLPFLTKSNSRIKVCQVRLSNVGIPELWGFLNAKLPTEELSAVRGTAGTRSCRGDTGAIRPPTTGTVLARSTGTWDVGGSGFCFELCGRTLSLSDMSLRTASGDSAPGGRNRQMTCDNITCDTTSQYVKCSRSSS